jgi:hypothetical protein
MPANVMGLLSILRRLRRAMSMRPKPMPPIVVPPVVPAPPPVPAPPAWVPSRTARLDIQTDFCSLRDSRDRAIFTPAIGGLPTAEQDEWIDRLVGIGATHCAVAVEAGYRDLYPRRDFYAAGEMDVFAALCRTLLGRRLIPIVFLTSGDHGDVNLPRIAPLCQWAVDAGLVSSCVWVCGFEAVKGGWTTRQFDAAALTMRQILGPDAVIACHLSPTRLSFVSNPHEDDDPYSSDINCWFERGGAEFDVFLLQLPSTGRDDRDAFGQPAWMEVAIEAADRFLALGTPMLAADGWQTRDHGGPVVTHGPVAQGPDWFARPRERGRPGLCLFETVAYHAINDPAAIDAEYVRSIATGAHGMGFRSFGNGLP